MHKIMSRITPPLAQRSAENAILLISSLTAEFYEIHFQQYYELHNLAYSTVT